MMGGDGLKTTSAECPLLAISGRSQRVVMRSALPPKAEINDGAVNVEIGRHRVNLEAYQVPSAADSYYSI